MEFDFYRNFLVLAESNTMSAAARKLNIVQTALSSQITKLEDYYGVKLVKRQKRRESQPCETGLSERGDGESPSAHAAKQPLSSGP